MLVLYTNRAKKDEKIPPVSPPLDRAKLAPKCWKLFIPLVFTPLTKNVECSPNLRPKSE